MEGVADVPRDEAMDVAMEAIVERTEGRTPLQVARCPTAARFATEGRCGLLGVPQDAKRRRQEVVLAALCGVPMDQALRLSRGPLELEGIGTKADGYDFVYAGNYITMDEGVIRESCLSRMSVKETSALTESVQAQLDSATVRIETLSGSRVLVLVKSDEMVLAPGTPPGMIEDDARAFLPSGKKGEIARAIMDKASIVLSRMSINDVRLDLGENPATHLWLWGGGKPQKLKTFFGGKARKACILSQSWMARGFARLCGMDALSMENPWDEAGELEAVDVSDLQRRLKDVDFLLVYVEAPESPAAFGTAAEKVRLLERMDLHVLAPLVKALEGAGPCRVMLTGDGVVPSRATKIPVALWGEGVAADGVQHWDEAACADGELGIVDAEKAFETLTE